MIPDARRHCPSGSRHPRHLAQPGDGIGHEVHDQLGQCRVELSVAERQLFRRGAAHVDAGVTGAHRVHERFRGIDRAHHNGARDELGAQRAGAAADVQGPRAVGDAGELGEPGSERR